MTLVAFDFDGTLSESEMTVLLGERYDSTAGDDSDPSVAEQMNEITERAMNDEIEYAESLRKRCALLEGLDDEEASAAFDQVVLRRGAPEVVHALNDAGVYTAILTGGFQRGVERALEVDGVTVDTIVSNRLPVEDGQLTGEVEGPLIEGTKDDALEELAETVDIDMSETVAVGDGANDVPMLEAADLSIGFDPKPSVIPACDVIVGTMAELKDALESYDVL
jgi:phosphoserine phosphatase